MKIEKSFCCDVIKDNVKVINKKLFVLEKVLYNTDLTESNEFLVDIVTETFESVKGNVNAILTVTNALDASDEEEVVEEKTEAPIVKKQTRGTRGTVRQTKQKFIQAYEEHLNQGTPITKLLKKYHLSANAFYKYLEQLKKGEFKNDV